jgi:hypothetical protein
VTSVDAWWGAWWGRGVDALPFVVREERAGDLEWDTGGRDLGYDQATVTLPMDPLPCGQEPAFVDLPVGVR